MSIPNEAIEAAFNAWWVANAYPGQDASDQHAARNDIRLYLEAAAPTLKAQALREFADWYALTPEEFECTMGDVVQDARERANDLGQE